MKGIALGKLPDKLPYGVEEPNVQRIEKIEKPTGDCAVLPSLPVIKENGNDREHHHPLGIDLPVILCRHQRQNGGRCKTGNQIAQHQSSSVSMEAIKRQATSDANKPGFGQQSKEHRRHNTEKTDEAVFALYKAIHEDDNQQASGKSQKDVIGDLRPIVEKVLHPLVSQLHKNTAAKQAEKILAHIPSVEKGFNHEEKEYWCAQPPNIAHPKGHSRYKRTDVVNNHAEKGKHFEPPSADKSFLLCHLFVLPIAQQFPQHPLGILQKFFGDKVMFCLQIGG